MTFEELFRHVTDILPIQQDRKRNICTQLCHSVLAAAARGDLTERARRHFRTLLKTGMAMFEFNIDHIVRDVGCACANHPITEDKVRKKFDFGPVECRECKDRCGIAAFLASEESRLRDLLERLARLPQSTKTKGGREPSELGQIEIFLVELLNNGTDPCSMNPCLTVGDLVIAIESRNIPHVYTMNGKESQHLCRWLGQSLILRKKYHVHDDIVCDRVDPHWPLL